MTCHQGFGAKSDLVIDSFSDTAHIQNYKDWLGSAMGGTNAATMAATMAATK